MVSSVRNLDFTIFSDSRSGFTKIFIKKCNRTIIIVIIFKNTMALNKATLPLLIKIADQGYKKTLLADKNFLAGLNIFKGKITCKGVAEAFKIKYFPPEKAITT